MKFAAVLLLLLSLVAVCLARRQRVSVKGRLVCNSKAANAARVSVKLVDEDFGPDPDDTLDTGRTGADGRFTLSGETSESGSIDPVFKAYHRCNSRHVCKRKYKVEIPKSAINGNTFDLGDINLDVKQSSESHECI